MDLDLSLQAFIEHAIDNPVIACRDGEDAMHFIDGNPSPDCAQLPLLMLLDLRLPKVDGIDVLRYAREHPVWKKLPIIVFSTSREKHDIDAAYELGLNAYIVKPIDYDSFAEMVKCIKTFWIVANEPPFPFHLNS